MKFTSTRDSTVHFDLEECIEKGLSPDGGLFVPEFIPKLNTKEISKLTFHKISKKILEVFFDQDISSVIERAFNFDIPLKEVDSKRGLFNLELFHGPTAAFKDIGARFLACYLNSKYDNLSILVATSGDTGGAVASAFSQLSNLKVILLYPADLISPFQEKQLTCWGKNVHSFRVHGTFDQCQALAKEAFQNQEFVKLVRPTSANSINLGRLLPQITYYAWSSLKFKKLRQKPAHFVIPTGNLGNALACFYARELGFPISKITMTSNANKTLLDYYNSGKYVGRQSISTYANAMDVGYPSNFERLQYHFPNLEELKSFSNVYSVDDEGILKGLLYYYESFDEFICPHSATAFKAIIDLDLSDCIFVSTAHPFKFSEVIERAVDRVPECPSNLMSIMNKKTHWIDIQPHLEDLYSKVKKVWND